MSNNQNLTFFIQNKIILSIILDIKFTTGQIGSFHLFFQIFRRNRLGQKITDIFFKIAVTKIHGRRKVQRGSPKEIKVDGQLNNALKTFQIQWNLSNFKIFNIKLSNFTFKTTLLETIFHI